ncbi:MAG: site-specific DNA-methyltransferase [Lachnospiraceae bacterium]|nr:site-specific DNA-methyltransferase [Lachnospiraceae bacterium]
MAILNWTGKDKVIGHHRDVKYKTLERVYSFDENGQHTEDNDSENMIIHGDNLEALKSLLPKYQGRIKCIYIDPPYNTGNENWVYNDNVNDPRIKKWLGQTVGKEGEDLSRHDKWLCMMYPRLKLLEKLLSPDGAIFISIDDNEVHNLRMMCDEIFGSNNFVVNICWQRTFATKNDAKFFSSEHEYILVYCKNINNLTIKDLPKSDKQNERYKNPDNDPRGVWISTDLLRMEHRANSVYGIPTPSGKIYVPEPGTSWRHPEKEMLDLIADNRVWFGKDGNSKPRRKRFIYEVKDGICPQTIWKHEDVGHTQEAKQFLKKILDSSTDFFATPKPVRLINQILRVLCNDNDIILDAFAGSGTTAHSVLEMNKRDGGNRKFILIEMMYYAENITAERVKRVISGYDATFTEEETIYEKQLTIKNIRSADEFIKEAEEVIEENKDKYTKVGKVTLKDDCIRVIAKNEYRGHVDGIGGNFSYYELGQELFNEDGLINSGITEDQLREYVYFSETQGAVLAENEQKDNKYYLGSDGNCAYYLYFEKDRITTLNHEFLATIKKKAESYIVYADKCVIDSESLIKNGITFKKIPRDVIRF